MEELLYHLHTICSEHDVLVLLIYKEISILLYLCLHEHIHLGYLSITLTSLHLSRKVITHLVELCRLAALTGYDKRSTCLIDKN